MQIEVCLDYEHITAKPDRAKAGNISDRLAQQKVAIQEQELAEAILAGRTFTLATFSSAKRNVANFDQAQLLGADIDAGNYSLQDVLQLSPHEPWLVYETMSSTAENHKWRVLYLLDEQLFEASYTKQLLKLVASWFGADTAVAEASRLFFGAKANCLQHYNSKAVLELAKLPAPCSMPEQSLRESSAPYSLSDAEQHALLKAQANGKLNLIKHIWLNDIKPAMSNPTHARGSRYMALWSSAAKLAQLELFADNVVASLLLKQISQEPVWHDWDKDAAAVIHQGIRWGRQHARVL